MPPKKTKPSLPPLGTYISDFPEGLHISVAGKRLREEFPDLKTTKKMKKVDVGKHYHDKWKEKGVTKEKTNVDDSNDISKVVDTVASIVAVPYNPVPDSSPFVPPFSSSPPLAPPEVDLNMQAHKAKLGQKEVDSAMKQKTEADAAMKLKAEADAAMNLKAEADAAAAAAAAAEKLKAEAAAADAAEKLKAEAAAADAAEKLKVEAAAADAAEKLKAEATAAAAAEKLKAEADAKASASAALLAPQPSVPGSSSLPPPSSFPSSSSPNVPQNPSAPVRYDSPALLGSEVEFSPPSNSTE
ncbi:hypothetical protein TrST_g14195 [Triparma strigata]|uniref:Uncharacterized protein n=1 Tax=Triparma strigata TaxID=1606541 RepID=A0A9W7EXS1_9STRA|nr:hypothetical protein TrST_g14195 [Triparma strigata]